MAIIRSTDQQLRDIREVSDSPFVVTHIDTCLGCYLSDHHNRDGELLLGVYVDGKTTVEQVFDELDSEFNAIAWDLGESRKGYDHDKAKAALAEQRADNAENIDKIFDSSLEYHSEDEFDGDSVQAWFLIHWDVPEEEES